MNDGALNVELKPREARIQNKLEELISKKYFH